MIQCYMKKCQNGVVANYAQTNWREPRRTKVGSFDPSNPKPKKRGVQNAKQARSCVLHRSIMAAAAAAATAARILELDPAHPRAGRVIDDIVRMEKRIFPKHESLARTFHDELKRRNTALIYSAAAATIPTTGDAAAASDEEEEVVGYAMYTCATSLCASITKLAGAAHNNKHSSPP